MSSNISPTSRADHRFKVALLALLVGCWTGGMGACSTLSTVEEAPDASDASGPSDVADPDAALEVEAMALDEGTDSTSLDASQDVELSMDSGGQSDLDASQDVELSMDSGGQSDGQSDASGNADSIAAADVGIDSSDGSFDAKPACGDPYQACCKDDASAQGVCKDSVPCSSGGGFPGVYCNPCDKVGAYCCKVQENVAGYYCRNNLNCYRPNPASPPFTCQ